MLGLITCPGAAATDVNEYGATVNLTTSIRALGVAKVDTSVPTLPTSPFGFAIQYLVADAAGNSAPVAWRLVRAEVSTDVGDLLGN